MRFLIFILLPFKLVIYKKKLTKFYIDYTIKANITKTITSSSSLNIWAPEQATNSEVEFEVNNSNKDRICSIFLEKLKRSISAPINQNFSFLKDVGIYISSESLGEELLAFKHDILNDLEKELICDVAKKDVYQFINQETFKFNLKTVSRELITKDVKVAIYTNFIVDPRLLK